MRRALLTTWAAIALLIFVADGVRADVRTAPAEAGLIPAQARKDAVALTLADAAGKAIRLSDHRGKVVLLDFWATWCAGCKIEIPWFMEFQRKYEAQGLRPVGVALDEKGWQTVQPYLQEHPITYPIVVGNAAAIAKQYNIGALPMTILIDRRGKIALTHIGMVDKTAFEQNLSKLLREK